MDPARDPGSDARTALKRRARHQPAFFARARRWLRPPRTLRPTRAGWCFFALTFGVGFAALNTGNNLLYMVLALMLAFLVLSGVLSEAALRGIRVTRRLPKEIYAEQEARVGLEIENDQKRVAAFAILVEDRVAEPAGDDRSAGRCFALRIPPGETEVRSYTIRPGRRGELEFRGFVVFTRFPFGLFSKALLLDAVETTLVYPAVDPRSVSPERGDASPDGSSAPRDREGASPVAAGLREFAPGDPQRRIHWRASLRRNALLVRSLETDEDRDVEVSLATRGQRAGSAFETQVRRAASEVVALLEAGRRVALRTEEHSFDAAAGRAHRARLLGYLARVEPSLRAEGSP